MDTSNSTPCWQVTTLLGKTEETDKLKSTVEEVEAKQKEVEEKQQEVERLEQVNHAVRTAETGISLLRIELPTWK